MDVNTLGTDFEARPEKCSEKRFARRGRASAANLLLGQAISLY
jgi:hypothetical protein